MDMDILDVKVTYPCEPATDEELSEALRQMFSFMPDYELFWRKLIRIPENYIPWTSVRSLCILASADPECSFFLRRSRLSSGAYVSRNGDWLVLIDPKASEILACIDRCGMQLKFLKLCGTAFTELDVSRLTMLEILDMQKNQALTAIQGLERLTHLTQLTLSSNNELTQLPSLDQLSQLTVLNLSHCSKLTQLPPLDKLSQLTHLNLSRCHSLTLLPPLDRLTQLTYLDLSGCCCFVQLPLLNNLTQLTTLNLSDCNNLTQLPSLDHLSQLTYLNLSRCSKLTLLPSLDNLSQLTDFDLSGCYQLTELPSLNGLAQLKHLDISYCSSLTQLPPLDSLSLLTHLDLSKCGKLAQLPPLDNLSQLTDLNLSYCRNLTQIPSLDHLSQLIQLDLSGCGINEIPNEIENMKALRSLCLTNLKLRELPDWLPEIAEYFTRNAYIRHDAQHKASVYLYGTTVEDIPDMSIFGRSYEMAVKWFEEYRHGRSRLLNEIKVVFLGDGEAGKSHTIARLMNDGGDPVDYTNQSTPGIVIKHRDHTLDGRTFRVHYWDFGGQEIMHSMHRIFLTGRTMYVVLINARDDTQSDRAQYWLHNIQSFAPNAPVLLVLNKIDQNPKASIDERTLRSRYSSLTQVVRLSALKFGQDEFNRAFTDVLLDEIRKTGFLDARWPGSWIQVKQRLENMDSHYILGDEYKAICRQCQVNDLQAELLHWFNDLGVSFCFCDREDYSLKKHVILRPDWITNGLYIILFNECPGACNGQIPHAAIYDLLERASFDPGIHCTLPEASYTKPGDVEYVLGVMRRFQLSLDAGNRYEFIPMLCQKDATVDIGECEKDPALLEFRMDFEYLPDNLLHRLMVERYSELDAVNAWRKGAIFEVEKLGYSAVVMIDGRQLRFFIRHTDPMHRPNTYLTMLKANADRIWKKMGLQEPKCQIIYKQNGETECFDYDVLKTMLEAGQSQVFSMIRRNMVPIADILHQSAPETLEDEMRLLTEITRSCQCLQDEPIYRLIKNPDGRGHVNGPGMEDLRNRRIRDDLLRVGFPLADQSQRGSGKTGKSIGELDLIVLGERGELWTIIEALRVSRAAKKDWDAHLLKLLTRYNSRGLTRVYLLTYVDADPADFTRIWGRFQDHIREFDPQPFTCFPGSFEVLDVPAHSLYIKTARSQYSCGDKPITVYHIFARIPTQNE